MQEFFKKLYVYFFWGITIAWKINGRNTIISVRKDGTLDKMYLDPNWSVENFHVWKTNMKKEEFDKLVAIIRLQ